MQILGATFVLLIRILSAAPALLGFIAGVSLALLQQLKWKYGIEGARIVTPDGLDCEVATRYGKKQRTCDCAMRDAGMLHKMAYLHEVGSGS